MQKSDSTQYVDTGAGKTSAHYSQRSFRAEVATKMQIQEQITDIKTNEIS